MMNARGFSNVKGRQGVNGRRDRSLLRLAIGLCAAWLTLLAFGAGGAQAMWLINGKGFEGEATFNSSGSFEIELPSGVAPLIKCNETGYGKIYEQKKVELTSTLATEDWLT
jgi:hypothetical protein